MANRVIQEMKRYTKDQLTGMACKYAMMEIVGTFYVGDIGDQTTEWLDDGSVVIVTAHAPGDLEDWRKNTKV